MLKEYSICPLNGDPCSGPRCPLLIIYDIKGTNHYYCGLNPAIPTWVMHTAMPIIPKNQQEDKKHEKE